jgi:hypothetical protein
MDLADLVHALLSEDLLTARQWVADAQRIRLEWSLVQRPLGLDGRGLAVAAGMAELLATRAGMAPPPWTATVGAHGQVVVLDPGLDKMPRSFERAKATAPESLRRRNLIALPNFLEIA